MPKTFLTPKHTYSIGVYQVSLHTDTTNPSGKTLTRNFELLTITPKLLSTMLVTVYPDQQTRGGLMNVQVRCNFCAHNFFVSHQWAGKAVSCPGCRRSIQVGITPQPGRQTKQQPTRQTGQGNPRKCQLALVWGLIRCRRDMLVNPAF